MVGSSCGHGLGGASELGMRQGKVNMLFHGTNSSVHRNGIIRTYGYKGQISKTKRRGLERWLTERTPPARLSSSLCCCCEETTTLTKERIQLGLAYHFRGLVCYYQGGKHWGTQADMGLEK